jgi:hypothetical protein
LTTAVGHSSLVVGLLCALGAVAVSNAQAPRDVRPEVERHIHDLISELSANSLLKGELVSGARGNGIHQVWMSDMQQDGIKRAVVWVSLQFDRRGKPKQMRVERTEYFKQYENGKRVFDTEYLRSIRASGLEQKLTAVALQKAAHGYWVDVPRPRPRPFTGAAKVEFFDDEWLPSLGAPIYCAGKSCMWDANANDD